ncbi:MAG: hypothetical protein GY729_06205 [Desulfobacteraceae bacterium]|nr:hypothetical protein [Desulfobacteraceae bacterium]
MNKRHLAQEQLLKCFIDINDLDSHAAVHLKECPGCREQINLLEKDLDALSKKVIARSFVPEPDIGAILNLKKRKPGFMLRLSKPLAVFCLAAVLMVSVIVHQDTFKPGPAFEPEPNQMVEFSTSLDFMFNPSPFEDFGLSEIMDENDGQKAVLDSFIHGLIHSDDDIFNNIDIQYPL